MLIYDALKKDHETVKELLTQLVHLSDDDGRTRESLIQEIRDELIPHSRAEEAVFYNSLRLVDESKSLAMHGYKEHMEAETLLRSLQMMDKLNTSWRNTAIKLQEALLHHIEEEEGEVFAAGKRLFTTQEAEALADAFERIKPEVKQEGLFGTTLDMMKNWMPPRLSKALGNSDLKNVPLPEKDAHTSSRPH
jgi:hemerythrin superfamily protein